VSPEQLLSELRALDIRLFVEDDRLRCSAPKGRLTTELERRITAHKAELIRILHSTESQAVAIPRRSVPLDSLPLSFAQERFWFLQSLDPESSALNITAYRRILGPMDVSALEAALGAVFKRHAILRTNFPELEGTPAQVIREAPAPELAIHDVSDIGEADRPAAGLTLIETLSKRTFDLANDPLLRASLIRLSEQDHLIALTMHHIVCDAWSVGILFSELKAFYDLHSRGSAAAGVPELPIDFGDYVFWERDKQKSATFQGQLDYWKKKLEGAPRYLEIPLDRARAKSAGSQARVHHFQLDAKTSESIKRLARQENASLFMALLTVFKALLFRYTNQADILVGTPVSTRTRPELELMIGCFINTQVLRTEVSSDLTARNLLTQVRSTVLESLNNTDVPFERLVNELVIERDLSRSPLFQVAFILKNTPKASEYEIVNGGTTVDLTLYMWESNGSIGGSLEYNSDLFNPETIARFAGCYSTLAAAMAGRPDSAIGRLPVVTSTQEVEWFQKYNAPHASYPRDLCTHEWIERQAAETPEAVAVVCGKERLTYRELSVRSSRLAHRLQALGVGPDRLVAVCLERSTDLVVAPLAVWKAGGAYVPLDPEYPSQRLAFMLEDSAATVVITQSRLLEKLPREKKLPREDKLPREVPKVICVDREGELAAGESSQSPAVSTTPENLAYVIYTSGSTGKPKGVEIRHRSVVNFLASMQRQPGIASSDRLLAITTLSFDIAGLELYLPLVSGAQVVIAPRAAALEGAALARMLHDSAITILQATPVTWRLLLEAGWQGSPGLKILCGGEALPRELAERLLETGSEVWNLYGPTETTIWSTLQRVDARVGRVPIGHPIGNTEVYVMDEYGQPVPPGVAGELYLGGEGLARGYLHRPELTAAKFVEHPFQAGARLYRTGDLGRRLPDGSLECIARMDHQVKLRGFRIELGEIESALEQQPGISQAVVVVREDVAGDQRLTAYLTAPDRAAADPGVLRRALLALLPDYMVPAAFVLLDQFPLTPNRKVDRKALLALEYHFRRPGMLATSGGADQELQIRGCKTKAAEVEVALARHPSIQASVLVAREVLSGGKRLVAYVAARNGHRPNPEELQAFLERALPEFAIPIQFVPLRSLPLTIRGDVDRHALGLSEEEAFEPINGYLPPSNHVELVMTEIWSEVLSVDKVGVLDNFFELGGHSLTASRLIARLRSALEVDLPLRSIFIDPTIASLSRRIVYHAATHGYRYTSEPPRWNCLVPAQPKGTRTPLFLVAGYHNPDDTLLVLSQLIPHLGMDQPVFGFRPRWMEGAGDGYASIKEVAREFVTELRAVQPKGPYLIAGHCVSGIVALEVAQLLLREGDEVKSLVLIDTARPTAVRSFFTNAYMLRKRLEHVADVVSKIVHSRGQARHEIIRGLIRRKFKIALSEQDLASERLFELRNRYWRLMYSHAPKKYPGRISLIVNEETARLDKYLGWQGFALGGLDAHTTPGDHATMLKQNGKDLAQLILKCINQPVIEPEQQPELTEVKVS
jgi:amino acid adenylation domain-containing protein